MKSQKTNNSEIKIQRPVYWKQVLITTFTVYPLLLLVSWFLKLFPIMNNLKAEIATFFAVIVVASLMVFPVMPLTMKLLGSWPFKNNIKKST